MSYKRADLTNKKIKEELERCGGNINTARKNLDCSYRLVHDVKNGKRKDPSEWSEYSKSRSYTKKVKNPCTCCGFREKGKGKRYLCDVCYKEEGDAFDEHPLNNGSCTVLYI